jgi:iron(III) transport system substrate-binding protein
MPLKSTALCVVGISAVLALTGCGGSNSAASSDPVGGAKAASPTLVVYAAEGYDQAMVTAFQKATGIPTRLYDDHTGIVLAKVQAEQNNPHWGVLWADGNIALTLVDEQGQLLHGVSPPANITAAGKALVPADRSYVPLGVTVSALPFYDSSRIAAPTSWQDLLTPTYRGKVGMLNPALDGPAYPWIAGLAQQFGGVSQGEAYLQKLRANGAIVYPGPKELLRGLQSGQIAVMLAQSAYGIGIGLKDPKVKPAYIGQLTPVPSVIGIDAKAPATEQAEARRFIQFVASPTGQKVMLSGDPSGDSLFWPLVSGTTTPKGLPAYTSLPVKPLDPTVWAPRQGTYVGWFSANIAR